MPDDPRVPRNSSSGGRRLLATMIAAIVVVLAAPLGGVPGVTGVAGVTASTSASSPETRSGPAVGGQAGAQTQAARVVRKQQSKRVGKSKRARIAARKARVAKARQVRRAKLAARAKARARAQAAQRGPAVWGATVRYHDSLPADWRWSLETAVAQWNAAGADVRLVRVGDPARAQVRVGFGDIGGNAGLATMGRTSGAFVKLSDRYRNLDATDPYYRVEVAGVLTHELGHVLGLDHTAASCELMGTTMDIVGCGIYDMAVPDAYRCSLIDPRTAAEAVRLYGGAVAVPRAGSCEVGAAA